MHIQALHSQVWRENSMGRRTRSNRITGVELDEFDLTALQGALVILVSLILLHSSPYTLDKPQLRETLMTWRHRDFGPVLRNFGNWYIVSVFLVVLQHVRGLKS
jgi:hypothetical protein